MRVHQIILARGAGQEQDRVPGNILEAGQDRRETESLGGSGTGGHGAPLLVHI